MAIFEAASASVRVQARALPPGHRLDRAVGDLKLDCGTVRTPGNMLVRADDKHRCLVPILEFRQRATEIGDVDNL